MALGIHLHLRMKRTEALDTVGRFAAAWEREFEGAPPLAYAVRGGDRWLRIHSLPGSKRYPEDEAEYAELLRRHNAVAGDLLGPQSVVVLIVCLYGDERGVYGGGDKKLELPVPLVEPLRLLRRVDPRELHPQADPAEDSYGYLSAACVAWSPGVLDPLIRQVADDQGPQLLVASENARYVYAPYDGGADLFFPSAAERDRARERYAAWLSREPSGL